MQVQPGPGQWQAAQTCAALHGGDERFRALPPRETIERLSLADFRRFWTVRLAEGPVRVTVVGDIRD